jgi:hypothetical protein
MTAKTMAEVLAEHQWYDATTDNEDPATGCTGCDDWFGSEDALDDGTFAAHQAAALSAAGFGLVADAKAEALEEAADDFGETYHGNWLRTRAASIRAAS